MAEILTDPEVRAAVAAQLLALVDDPNDIQGTHGPDGWVFTAPDDVAHQLYLANMEGS
jgi:hypothetical protein